MSLMVHHKTRAVGSSQRKARKNAGDSISRRLHQPQPSCVYGRKRCAVYLQPWMRA